MDLQDYEVVTLTTIEANALLVELFVTSRNS